MKEQTEVGELIKGTKRRDAIHIAVAPVVANEKLSPGQHVGFAEAGNVNLVGKSAKTIGIVDPFLGRRLEKGDRFYLFLYPNTITSLRHEWEHPAFIEAETSDIAASRAWLEKFTDNFEDLKYDELIGTLAAAAEDETEYFLCRGYDTPQAAYDDRAEMWRHYEIVSGMTVKNKERVPFSCSC